MKQRKFTLGLIAILVVCFIASLTLAACVDPDDGDTTAVYYLSMGGATYDSESSVPADVKLAGSNDVYTLTVELTEGDSFTINKVGSSDIIGYDSIFSTAGKLVQGANNSIVVAETGTYALTLDVSDAATLMYSYTAPAPTVATVENVEITTSLVEMNEGDVSVFVATVTYSDATTSNSVEWTSGNTAVATIDASGVVTAVSAGTTEITATADGKTDKVTLTVNAVSDGLVKSVTLDKHELTLELDGSEQLVATVLPTDATNKAVLWTSSNESVATVDNDGTVHAVSAGTATITVTTAQGGHTDYCVVTVRQAVKSITLSASTLTVYTGEGAAARDITVTINPTDASNKNYTVEVAQESDIISYTVNGTSITVTGIAVGTATLTVTSEENSEITATCVITVADISSAVPALSADNVTLDIGETSDAIAILLDNGQITSFTATASASIISVSVDTSNNTFTVTSSAFGSATVTVNVSYGDSKTATLTLNVRVAAEYFYLTGNFDGTAWDTPTKVDGYLTTYDVLMEEVSDGIYEITRDFKASDKLYILPSSLDDDWNYGLRHAFYTAQSNASSYNITIPDADNVQIGYAGNYTVRLTLTGSSASWTVIVNSIDISKATLSTTASSLKDGQTATLTLAIEPNVVTVAASSIEWFIKEADYSNLVVLSVDGTAKSATLALSELFTGESVNVTVVVTITIDGEVVATAEQQIALLGNTVNPVTDITFDDEGDVLLDVSSLTLGNWTIPVTAHVNSDASIQTITYSIKEGTLYANGDGTHVACSIDSNGIVTAWMFGTYTVVATSDGTNSEGSVVYAEKTVRVYSQTFYLNINWDSDHTANPSTTTDNIVYTWTDVKISAANQPVVILYAGLGASDDWYSTIRSGGYLNSANSTSGVITANSGGNGSFTVTRTGMYNITLDLSGSAPSVTFVRTGDVVSSDTWSTTSPVITVVGAGNTWNGADDGTNVFYTVESQTVDSNNPYVFVTYNFSASKFASVGSGAKCALNVNGSWYMGSYYGSNVTTSWTSGKWWHETGSGNLEAGGFTVANTTWTFIVKFNEDASVVGVQIEQGTITSASQFTDVIE